MSNTKEEDVLYIDESGMDSNDSVTDSGYAKKGERLVGEKSSKKGPRTNVIAVRSSDNKLHAPFIFTGSMTRQDFEFYLKEFLVPFLRNKNYKYLVMDNASFHKGGSIKAILNEAGITLIYLPTYSPDLNPIEKKWSVLKKAVRRLCQELLCDILTAMCTFLGNAALC